MAKKNILSTAEFLAQMRKTPLGSTTELTFGDAQALSRAGIDISNYGNETNEYVDSLEQETKESQSWWDNIFGTIDNIANSFGKGFVSAFEGIIDAGVWLAGEIGSWFGADTQWAEDFINVDMAGNLANFTETFANFNPWGIGKSIANMVQYGGEYWKDMGLAWSTLGLGQWGRAYGVSDQELQEWREKYAYGHDVLEENQTWFTKGVLTVAEAGGQLVAEIIGSKGIGTIAGAVGKGAGWTAKGIQAATKVGTLAALGVSAAGGGTQAALQEGADYEKAGLYGLLSGATEVGTEMIGGVLADVDSGLVGKLMRKTKVGNKVLNNFAGNMIMNGVAEGFEEVLSDVADPLWKKLTINPELDLAKEYTSKEFFTGMLTSFAVGSIIGAIGSAPKAYRASKFSVNGVKISAEGYQAFSEFDEKNVEMKDRARLVAEQLKVIEKNGHDFAEGTDFRMAIEEALNADDVSESDKKRLQKAIERANIAGRAVSEYAQEFEKKMEKWGLTEDDLIAQYGKNLRTDINKIEKDFGFKFVSDTNVTEEIITNDGEIHVPVVENVEAPTEVNVEEDLSKPITEEIETQVTTEENAPVEEEVAPITADKAESLARTAQAIVYDQEYLRTNTLKFFEEERVQPLIEKYTAIANSYIELDANGKQLFINHNVAKDIIKEITGGAKYFTTKNGIVELSEILESSETIDEAIEKVDERLEATTTDKVDAGNKEIVKENVPKIPNRTRFSSGIESLFNKVIDSQYTLRRTLVQLGLSEARAEQIIGKAVNSYSVGMNIASNGYYHIEDGKIVYDSKGIYSSSEDGIVNRIQKYAKENHLKFDDVLSRIQEGLLLEHEVERSAQGKDVFGKYINSEWVNSAMMRKMHKYFPELHEMFSHMQTYSEAEFEHIVDLAGELNEQQQEIVDEARKHFCNMSAEEVETKVNEIRKEIPIYDEIVKDLRVFEDQILKQRVSSGMMTQEDADLWKEMYPNYVPTYRVVIGKGANATFNSLRLLSSDIKGATGSDLVVQDIFSSIMRQSQYVNHFDAMNQVLNELYNKAKAFQDRGLAHPNVTIVDESVVMPRATSTEQVIELNKPQISGRTVFLYKDGQVITMEVSENLLESLNALDKGFKNNLNKLGLVKFTEKTASTMRKLMTSWNPFFSWWRNPLKDIQSAVIYTQNGTATLLRNWGRSFTTVFGDAFNKGQNTKTGQLYQIYIAQGGQAANISGLNLYDEVSLNEKSLKKNIRKVSQTIGNFMEVMENTTRFAEFLSTYERLSKQGTMSENAIIQEALNDAREITINFSRKGTWTAVLNRYIPFLTANIEGAARNVRAFISPRSKKKLVEVIIKMLILGVAPQIIQELIYGNDEEYQSLSDTMRSNYYLIKVGTEFIRIPKGYIQQAFSSVVTQVSKSAHGEEIDKEDLSQMFNSIWNSVGVDISGLFFQPIIDAKNNRTWYGGEIVSQKYDLTRPSEQYDRNTSAIAKWLGKITGWSPLKIDYVLGQMTGIVGDILLPATSENGYNPVKFIKDQFVTDSVYKNRYSSDFYDYKQEVGYDKTDGDAIASVVYSYLNTVSSAVSELKKQQDELATSDMSQSEKEAQDRIIQATINATYKAALVNAEKLKVELANYELSEESLTEDKLEAYRKVIGAEFALQHYNTKVYQKAQCYYKAGVSYDNFYVWYFSVKNLDSKESVQRYINRLIGVPMQIKDLLYALFGYKLSNEKILSLTRWLKNKGLTEEEIALIL